MLVLTSSTSDLSRVYNSMNVKKVFLLTLLVAAAYGPLGLAFGVYLTTTNIAWYWAPISAFMIFAGSIEF